MLYSIVSGDFLTMCAVCCVVGEGTWWREDVHAIVTTVWLNKYKKVCVCVCVCVCDKKPTDVRGTRATPTTMGSALAPMYI